MKRLFAFGVFLLFLGGIALVNVRGVGERRLAALVAPTPAELSSHGWHVAHAPELAATDIQYVQIVFAPDGRLFVDGACNRYSGRYALDQEALHVSELAGTRRACAAALMRTDEVLVAMLSGVAAIRTDGRALMLYSAVGDPVARLAAGRTGTGE